MAIPITLVHNPEAGFKQLSKENYLQALQQKGFAVTYFNYKEYDPEEALKQPGQLVVIGGGDGTLTAVAKHVIHQNIPLAFLPLGTANNIASSLGLCQKATDLIASWDLNGRKPFDLGISKCQETESCFLESVGFGLLPRLALEHSKGNSQSSNSQEELRLARQHLLHLIQEQPAQEARINIDGQVVKGNFLLVQILNVGFAGPRLALAPAAKADDGLLSVVLVREDDRDCLSEYVRNYQEENPSPPFPIYQGQTVTVDWPGNYYHNGNKAQKESPSGAVQIRLLPHKLEYL